MKSSRWKKLTTGVLLGAVVILVIVYVGRASFHIAGSRQLTEVHEKLDAAEPGWRLADLELARQKAAPPREQNPSNAVLDLHGRIPAGWKERQSKRDWNWSWVSNRLPSSRHTTWLEAFGQLTEAHRTETRTTLLRPEFVAARSGYYPIHFTENPLATLLPHAEGVRGLLDYLACDSRLAAVEGKSEEALRSARAQLVLARSIGEEPILISQLVRMACARSAATSTFQTLAWSQPKGGLAELQDEFRKEADVPHLLLGLRGERAMMDQVFEGLQSGTISLRDLESVTGGKAKLVDDAALHLYRGLLPGDRAMSLKLHNQFIEAAQLPYHERMAAFARVGMPPRPPESFRYIVSSLLLPAADKVCAADLRVRADLLTASAAIACERFRLARGRWPAGLDEIPRDILPEIPADPFNGEPLQYLRLADGIAVFSVGDDRPEEIARRKTGEDPLAEIGRGWKLWDPEQRGLPPLPERNEAATEPPCPEAEAESP